MPVSVRSDLSEENLRALLAEGVESETLDYKKVCDISNRDALLEIAKDVGAMQILGGYLVIGADDNGNPTGQVTQAHAQQFEQAALRAKLVTFLGQSIDVRSRYLVIDGNGFILVYVAENPFGFLPFKVDGKRSYDSFVFRKGDVFARHGTASEKWDESDIVKIQQGIVAREKEKWMAIATATAATPMKNLDWQLDASTFIDIVSVQARNHDLEPFKWLLTGIGKDVGDLLTRADGEEHIKTVLDRLTCISSLAFRLGNDELFNLALSGLVTVHKLPFDSQGNPKPDLRMDRILLHFEILQRITAIGAVAERLQRWHAIRALVLQRGHDSYTSDFYPNWYREDGIMAARADLQRAGGSSLIGYAQGQIERLECLRFDLPAEDEALLSSVCRFDFLASIVGIDDAGEPTDRAFFPNFAGYRAGRVMPAAEMLLDNSNMRATLFEGSDGQLAEALRAIGSLANSQNGLRGWDASMGSAKIRMFLDEHPIDSVSTA